jgi:hypothetical protein
MNSHNNKIQEKQCSVKMKKSQKVQAALQESMKER